MNLDIYEKHWALQLRLAQSMRQNGGIAPIDVHCTIGEKYNSIRDLAQFLNQEIDEVFLSLSEGDRDIHKPWKKECNEIRSQEFISTAEVREEAIDVLCFAMNICMSAGITPDIIEQSYDLVHDKIDQRLTESEQAKNMLGANNDTTRL